ncbi:uncharacterized protein DFL_000420 [Arthrobotrys flagrans]|uniref:Uncharacterized protein n=1 Tax=Arthrobotrys flagrans TaxID=97331 RepID=A0A437AF99_ARTFL|nr:hypothetical protein DFL_000420 [Arthrobotrys flagrans]
MGLSQKLYLHDQPPSRELERTFAPSLPRPWGDTLLLSELICTELTQSLRSQAVVAQSSFFTVGEFDSDLLDILTEGTPDIRLVVDHIVSQLFLKPKLDLAEFPRRPPSLPSYDAKDLNNWNIRFLQAIINRAVFMSNNSILHHIPVKELIRRLGTILELRAFVVWIMREQPKAVRGFIDALFKRTIHASDTSRALDLVDFVPLKSEELIVSQVLKSGNVLSLRRLLGQNIILKDREVFQQIGSVYLEEEIGNHLDTIITLPKVLNFQTIPKICEILWSYRNRPPTDSEYILLKKYSDWNEKYKGRDLGTKLFLAASFMIDNKLNSGGIRPGFTAIYEELAKYILEHCVGDYKKALVNAIEPISMLLLEAGLWKHPTGISELLEHQSTML